MVTQGASRPRITLRGREIQHNGGRAKVVFRLGRISVGCTDVDTNAAEFLLAEYRKAFPPTEAEVVLQDIRPDTTRSDRSMEEIVESAEKRISESLRFGFSDARYREALHGALVSVFWEGRASCTD